MDPVGRDTELVAVEQVARASERFARRAPGMGSGAGGATLSRPAAKGTTGSLPAPLSSLIGRERDVEEVAAALSHARVLTLTGAGGVGKTRLAIEAAARSVAEFTGGVWWIELAPLADSGVVESTLVRALDVRPLPGQGELDAAIGFLAARRALLVLDNCEHVVESAARVAAALLPACPSLAILATSRAPLAIAGETRWAVAPLSLPSGDSLSGLSDSDAARLFVDRAAGVDRARRVNAKNAWAVAEICRQLDGIPLALELAAARAALLSAEAIAHGLDDALGLLASRSRSAEARHRTLRASLDWSYGLLPAHARALLRRLGVFAGGATLELAREVCAGEGLERGELLETLVEHSLVQVDARDEVVRYRLLETVRQYALERLEDSGESARARDRHRDALLALAERLREQALTPRQPEVLSALDAEAANLTAASDRALETDPGKALRLCLALDFWYRARARFQEADDAYARAVGASDPPPVLHTRALAAWAWIVGSGGDFGRANELAADAATRAEATGDQRAIAGTLLVLANHRFFTDPVGALGQLDRCRELALAVGDEYILGRTEALLRGAAWYQQDERACRAGFDELRARLERLGDRETLAWFWITQGAVRYALGEHADAAVLLERAVATAAEIGEATADRSARTYLALIDAVAGHAPRALEQMRDLEARTLLHGGSFALPWIELFVGMTEAACDQLDAACGRLTTLVELAAWGAAHAAAWASAELAEVLRLLGHDDAATRHGARALEATRRLRNTWLAAKTQLTLGRLAARRGEWAHAERLHHQALATIWERHYRLELPGALEALAEVAVGLERHTDAARILGAAQRARRELDIVAWPAQRAALAELTARVGHALGQPALERALSEGVALQRDDAVAWLRRARGARKRPRHGWESLTPTEVDVVRHAAAAVGVGGSTSSRSGPTSASPTATR